MGKRINSASVADADDVVEKLRRMVDLGLEVLQKIKKLEATESFPVGTWFFYATYFF